MKYLGAALVGFCLQVSLGADQLRNQFFEGALENSNLPSYLFLVRSSRPIEDRPPPKLPSSPQRRRERDLKSA